MDKKYSIQDLVDIDRLRVLFETFSKATGFTTGFVSYPEQQLLITTGWRDICTKFHRVCPSSAECCKESNVYLTASLKSLKELSIKPCGNGLVDGATPVIIRGVHLASLGRVHTKCLHIQKDCDRVKRWKLQRNNTAELKTVCRAKEGT